MGYIANVPLRFGDGWIHPGESVPVEPGRNYRALLQRGEISLHADKDQDAAGPRGRVSSARSPRSSD
jgi:hypothetical protein